MYHVRRTSLPKGCPVHVTLRMQRGIPSLRCGAFVRELRRSFREACERGDSRVVHFSIQRDHVHLLVEAAGKQSLASGMKSISARVARAVQRAFGRTGAVLLGRYHVRALRTPREVRNALAYVLLNARKHWVQRMGAPPPVCLDAASSGAWFDGWRTPPPEGQAIEERAPVAAPRTWLLRLGWRRHGLLDPSEVPGRARPGA